MAISNSGLVFGTTAASVRHTTSGTATWLPSWTSPANALTTDSAYSTATQSSTPGTSPNIKLTEALVVSGFGLSIPTGAAIVGIEVTVRAATSLASGTNPYNEGAEIALLLDSTKIGLSTASDPTSLGDNGALGSVGLTTTMTTRTVGYTAGADDPDAVWGGCTPLSGTTNLTQSSTARRWTAADLNSANFGVALTFTKLMANNVVSIESVGIKVYYVMSTGRTYASTITQPAAQTYNSSTSPTNGTAFWTNPNNALSTNGTVASVTQVGSSPFLVGQPLVFSGFGFSLPSATVLGIRVFVVMRRGTTTSTNIHLLLDKAVVGVNGAGTVIVGNGTTSITGITTSLSTLKAGSSSTFNTVAPFTNGGPGGSLLKGSTRALATADLNSTSFAVAISPDVLPANDSQYVDSVSIEVFYDPAQKSLSATIGESTTYALGLTRSRPLKNTISESTITGAQLTRTRTLSASSNEYVNVGVSVSKSSSGPTATTNNPTTSTGTGWTGTANVYAQDGAVASIVPVTTGSAPLKVQGFGFTIPAGATISGISFDAYAYQSGGSVGAIDVVVNALKADGSASTTSASTTSIDTTASYKTYGTSTSLWGETWGVSDINDLDFGVQFTPTATGGGSGGTTTSGYTDGSSATSTSTSLGSWSSPSNALTNNSAWSTCSVGVNNNIPSNSPYLYITGFGFSIPSGATILGIEVSVNCMYSTAFGNPGVLETVVVGNGSLNSANKGSMSTAIPSSFAYVTYGDTTSDTWSTSWTADDINSSDFGVTLRAATTSSGSSTDVRVEHVRVRVAYSSPSSPDRVFNVDHVRATINYTPVDKTAKLVDFIVTETASVALSNFTRQRDIPVALTETSAMSALLNRSVGLSTQINELYDIVMDFARQRNVPISFTIDQLETLAAAINVQRASVTETFSPMTSAQGAGTIGWVNTGNVYVQDGLVAPITPALSGNSPLRLQNFGYALPPQVQILGVQFEAYAYQSGGTAGSINLQAKLIKADGTTAASSQTITNVGTVTSYKTFGGNSSLWGETLTGADVNDVDFGVELTPIGAQDIGSPTTSSYTNPATAASEAGSTGDDWSNTSSVFVSDSTSAQAGGFGDTTASRWPYLNVTNFGFSIPAGSTIDAVEVGVVRQNRYPGGQNGGIIWQNVQLIKGGTRVGTNKATSTPWTVGSYGTDTFGDTSSDVWGTTLTAADVNASDFGISLRPKYDNTAAFPGNFANIDNVQIRVTYRTLVDSDRTLNVDHVRATVTYIPIDLKALGTVIVNYLEAANVAISRARKTSAAVVEHEAHTSALGRNRGTGGFHITETETMSTSVNRLRLSALSFAESIGHQFTASRARQLQPSAIQELEGFSFGALRRLRNVVYGWNENTGAIFNIIRARQIPLTVPQLWALNEALGRARKIATSLSEQLIYTPQLGRKKQIAAALAEVEALSFAFLKVKLMSTTIAQLESVGVNNIIRTRALTPLIQEIENETASLKRARTVSSVIPESTSASATLGRFRKVLAQVLENEAVNFGNLERIREVIAAVHEQEAVDFAVSIILGSSFPEAVGVTITWYESEKKADGTINYKMMTETWLARRAIEIENAVVVDVAVPATQIINLG